MLLSSSTARRVCCARCVPAASMEITGWQRSRTSAGQRIDKRLLPLRYDLKLWIGSGDGSAAYLPG
jgi:hypothetical protein